MDGWFIVGLLLKPFLFAVWLVCVPVLWVTMRDLFRN